ARPVMGVAVADGRHERPQLERLTAGAELDPAAVQLTGEALTGQSVHRRSPSRLRTLFIHSHSIVAGGLLLTSKTTRLTPDTLLMTRVATRDSRSSGSRDQSAVMKSSVCTARRAMTF